MTDRNVTEIMTSDVVSVTGDTSVQDAARLMRDQNIGDVVVIEGESVRGLVTDRDLVLRVIAEQRDPTSVTVEEICSEPVAVLSEDDTAQAAIEQMRQSAIRRLPVVDNDGRPMGMVSLGDLAVHCDPGSVLADISAAPPTSESTGDAVPRPRAEAPADRTSTTPL